MTAAAELAGNGRYQVLLLENAPDLGGLAGTFRIDGHTFDTGSHRLHEDCVPAVAQPLHELCGDDLLRREGNGVIYVRGKPLAYPPTVFDVLRSLTARERGLALYDLVRARVRAVRGSQPRISSSTRSGTWADSYMSAFTSPTRPNFMACRPPHLASNPRSRECDPFVPARWFSTWYGM